MRRAQGVSSSAVAGTADEDAPPAFACRPRPVTLNGPEMSTPGNVRRALHLRQLGDRLQRRVGLGERALDEGHADLVLAGLDLDPDVVEARLHLVRGDRLVLVDGLQVLRPAEGALEHARCRRWSG